MLQDVIALIYSEDDLKETDLFLLLSRFVLKENKFCLDILWSGMQIFLQLLQLPLECSVRPL